MKETKGITLVSLVITIIILMILASISIISIFGNNGLLNKAQTANEETKKSQATGTMNLKITNIQISSYTENKELPNLQYLADKLCEDNDMEYVLTTSKEHASLDKIDVTNISSIFTKLKDYPYEFEINSSLQLASIDGVKIDDNNNDETVTLTKNQYNSILNRLSALENKSNNTTTNEKYSTDEQEIGTWINNKKLYRKVIQTTVPDCKKAGTSDEKRIDVSDLNIDVITSTTPLIIGPDWQSNLPLYNSDNINYAIRVFYLVNEKKINIRNSSITYNSLPIYITIEYTKITD